MGGLTAGICWLPWGAGSLFTVSLNMRFVCRVASRLKGGGVMRRIYIDMSTARGIQNRIEQRVTEIKALDSNDKSWEHVIFELLALHKEIDMGLDELIEDMHRESQERALQQQIRIDDAGLTVDDLKAAQF
tara:strand:- start:663 stop:1055 length:393 start_codon:yes stop_codon:yes gene_type:complete